MTAGSAVSFNHLVGAGEHGRRHVDAEHPGCLQVDDELELARLQHRQVGRVLALEDAAGIDSSLAIRVRKGRSVAHQPAGFGILAHVIDRRYSMVRRQRDELYATAGEKWLVT